MKIFWTVIAASLFGFVAYQYASELRRRSRNTDRSASDRRMQNPAPQTGLLGDSDWEPLDGELCRVIEFTPLAGRMEGRKVKSSSKGLPYGSIEIESPALTGPTTGYVTHKLDFAHLSEASRRRESEPDSEVVLLWSRQHLDAKVSARLMPRMWVMLCRKNAYEWMTHQPFEPEPDEPELRALFYSRPIAQWKPDVME